MAGTPPTDPMPDDGRVASPEPGSSRQNEHVDGSTGVTNSSAASEPQAANEANSHLGSDGASNANAAQDNAGEGGSNIDTSNRVDLAALLAEGRRLLESSGSETALSITETGYFLFGRFESAELGGGQNGHPGTPYERSPTLMDTSIYYDFDEDRSPGCFDFGFRSYADFYQFITDPVVQEAYQELRTDFLVPKSRDGRSPVPVKAEVVRRVMLCEVEPRGWTYTAASPDKSSWCCEAHYARFSIKLQVVRRRLSNIPPGPLTYNRRRKDVGIDLELAALMWKMEGVHETFRPSATEVAED
ncbi:hypothetical protein B0T10DRAFT_601257 [Thelonectria olida]|uniref:Uncharacterized protein n=1 Tax=Thelonectria olida TaxID=1576542 RepID=A0A9P9AW26_9HYPO|nr:hypothetical protein B0T10DRAFT_601257 [Thelonectria olida]